MAMAENGKKMLGVWISIETMGSIEQGRCLTGARSRSEFVLAAIRLRLAELRLPTGALGPVNGQTPLFDGLQSDIPPFTEEQVDLSDAHLEKMRAEAITDPYVLNWFRQMLNAGKNQRARQRKNAKRKAINRKD
jgi:hypothetical protein